MKYLKIIWLIINQRLVVAAIIVGVLALNMYSIRSSIMSVAQMFFSKETAKDSIDEMKKVTFSDIREASTNKDQPQKILSTISYSGSEILSSLSAKVSFWSGNTEIDIFENSIKGIEYLNNKSSMAIYIERPTYRNSGNSHKPSSEVAINTQRITVNISKARVTK